MSKCVGVGNKACEVEFYDPKYPDDTLCDKCFDELCEGVTV
jgi:hypothetical protein